MTTKKSLALLGTAIVVVASGSNEIAVAGIDAGGAPSSKGRLTQFSSIYVNGVKFNTDHTVFIIDGSFGSEADLQVGQVVTVRGFINGDGKTGVANIVTFDNAVEGPISVVEPSLNQLVVLGQTIVVGNDTSYSVRPGVESIGDLSADDIIEVSGFVDADGRVVASHISAAEGVDEFNVTGKVTSVDSGTYRLAINDLSVDFSAANLYGLSGGMPQPGEHVEVIGTHLNASGEFVAARIYGVQPAIAPEYGSAAELEGLVTRYEAPWNFDVDGVPVTIGWGTQFTGGSWYHISEHVHLEVEGHFDASGTLFADRIEFEQRSSTQLDGFVQRVDGVVVSVNGLEIGTSADTEFEDESDADEHRFGADDLRTGDYVKIRGYDSGDGVIATRIERHDADDDWPDHDDDSDSDSDDGDD